MNIGSNKGHAHPYGSTLIPTNSKLEGPTASTPKLPGSPSVIPGSLGISGTSTLRDLGGSSSTSEPSAITRALEGLLDAFTDCVADKVVAKLAASTKSAPDVEDLNRLFPSINEDPTPKPMDAASIEALKETIDGMNGNFMPSASPDATLMHIDLEQALREREHVKVTRFAPGPLGFKVGAGIEPGVIDCMAKVIECVAYAQPYGRGYTNGAKPDEYVVIADGRQVYRSEGLGGLGFIKERGYSSGLTLAEVLAIVDGPMRSSSFDSDS